MRVEIRVTYGFEMEKPSMSWIYQVFSRLILFLLTEFMDQILLSFAIHSMNREGEKPFACRCGNKERFTWKTQHGKLTQILTMLGKLKIHQLQVECKDCGARFFITRQLLGVEPRKVLLPDTKKRFALIGALTTFRVSEKITSLFGLVINKMAIWRSVQDIGKTIEFEVDPNEEAGFEVPTGRDTGIPIVDIKKRGLEMKVIIQHKKNGKVRIAGLGIDHYDRGWGKLFTPLLKTAQCFKSILLVTDGDTSILKGIKTKIKIIHQRCLWHMPHQLKYCLWKDKVKRKTSEWRYVMGEMLSICTLKKILDDEEEIQAVVQSKQKQALQLIEFCKSQNYTHSMRYLENAQNNLFTAFENKLKGKTTSRVERVMKTINMRINVGKWKPQCALNVNKIRLAYYYNEWDVKE